MNFNKIMLVMCLFVMIWMYEVPVYAQEERNASTQVEAYVVAPQDNIPGKKDAEDRNTNVSTGDELGVELLVICGLLVLSLLVVITTSGIAS